MKRSANMLAFILAALPVPASSDQNDELVQSLKEMHIKIYEDGRASFCKQYSGFVGPLHDFRYQGKPIENFIQWAEKTGAGEKDTVGMKEYRLAMVMAAYSAPRMSTQESIAVQRQELLTEFYIRCWENFSEISEMPDPGKN
ncbi:MAG: hypothetical protein V4753_04725 [Pseudomonadota bacterium]